MTVVGGDVSCQAVVGRITVSRCVCGDIVNSRPESKEKAFIKIIFRIYVHNLSKIHNGLNHVKNNRAPQPVAS